MPDTRARPPRRQNGTSAPSLAASATSSLPAQRRTAAASADPPPSPPPAGMRLTSRTCASAAHRPQGAQHQVVVAGGDARRQPRRRGHAGPQRGATGGRRRGHGRRVGTRPGIDDLEAPALAEGQLVGQVEAHHLGVEQVVTVGADAGHPQRERELGRREDDAQSEVFCLPSHTLTARSTAV